MKKVVSYKMTKAFSNLEKAQNVLNGREKQMLLELFEYIMTQNHNHGELLEQLGQTLAITQRNESSAIVY